MALNKSPTFASTPLFASAVVTGANAAYDGTGVNIGTLLTAPSDGAIVTSLVAYQRGATVAAISCRIFVSYDAGVTKHFYGDQTIPIFATGTGVSVTPVTFVNKLNPDAAIRLPASGQIYVTTAAALATGIVFSAEYSSLSAA